MIIQSNNKDFIMPRKGSATAGAFDIFMPESGSVDGTTQLIGLGFSAAVPAGHVALLLPRSSIGAKHGLELNNTTGVIDSDYRGEWVAALRTKTGLKYKWNAGDRLIQFLIVPVTNVTLHRVDSLDETIRGIGGFGSTGL